MARGQRAAVAGLLVVALALLAPGAHATVRHPNETFPYKGCPKTGERTGSRARHERAFPGLVRDGRS
jgi:hypothetical protein